MENSEENVEKSLTEMSYELRYMKRVAEFEIEYQNGEIDYVNLFYAGNFIGSCSGSYYMEVVPVE